MADIRIEYSNLWTYDINSLGKGAVTKRLPLKYLNNSNCTHIHGDLKIIIDNRTVPYISELESDDVCIGYWIEMINNLFIQFSNGCPSYSIQGGDQGKPEYKFDRRENKVYLSIVDSPLGGKKDIAWQEVCFEYKDFKREYRKLKVGLIDEIASDAPQVLTEWKNKIYAETSYNVFI